MSDGITVSDDSIAFLGALPKRPANAKYITHEAFTALNWPWSNVIRDTRAKEIINELVDEGIISASVWSTAGWSFRLTDEGEELVEALRHNGHS